MGWKFYGRESELRQLDEILDRKRFFFLRITGRRRIGKTTLVQKALERHPERRVLYVQIPDSGPAGVLSAVGDAMQTFGAPDDVAPPRTLREMAQLAGTLSERGYLVVLDEFQYFSRKHLSEFSSHLQEVVDDLLGRAASIPGGLVVLGSLQVEMEALLEARQAPLYNRTTDVLDVGHLDLPSVLEILQDHADTDPHRLLFLWNLFEGVPKFYRDAWEQQALDKNRPEFLRRMFFESSSPLRTEASHWFLGELRGRYDVALKYVARNPGCSHSDLQEHVRSVSTETSEQVAGYLKILIEKYQMVERRQPILAAPRARAGRYYIRDNFLRSWLHALAPNVAAVNFRPMKKLIADADRRLGEAEGHGFERMAATLLEEQSRRGRPGFGMTQRIDGYWDRAEVEIDVVVLDAEGQVIRFGSCKRSESKLAASLQELDAHVEAFLRHHGKYRSWEQVRLGLSPGIEPPTRAKLEARGVMPLSLSDLLDGLPGPPVVTSEFSRRGS